MSAKDFYSEVEIVRSYCGRVTITDSVDSNGTDTLFCESIQLLYGLLCDITPLRREVILRRLGSWLKPGGEISLEYLFRLCKDFDAFCIDYLTKAASEYALADFKRLFGGLDPFLCLVREVLEEYLRTRSSRAFRSLHTFACFLTRLHIPDVPLGLQEEYMRDEEEMKKWHYDETLINKMNRLAKVIFKGCAPVDAFFPKNGPGSTTDTERCDPSQKKYFYMTYDQRLRYLEKWIGPVDSWLPMPSASGLQRQSKIVEVPKGLFSRRVISSEPAMLQYMQQGVSSMIRHWIKHSILGRFIHLQSQEYSRKLTLEGSIVGDYDTIDLSKASDSVTLSLVKAVFKGTWLLPFLICTRSDYTSYDGTIVRLEKFAPMGSGVCFDVESLIFCLVVLVSYGARNLNKLTCSVYGDDIVVPSFLSAKVIANLEKLNFKVNREKTFTGHHINNFRESCGVHFLNGDDVSPLHIPRFYKGCFNAVLRGSPSTLSSLITFANNAKDGGYHFVRRVTLALICQCHYIDHRKKIKIKLIDIPKSISGDLGLKIEAFTDLCHYRHNSNLQRTEQKALTLKVKRKVPTRDKPDMPALYDKQGEGMGEAICYFEWLRDRARQSFLTEDDRINDNFCNLRVALDNGHHSVHADVPTLRFSLLEVDD